MLQEINFDGLIGPTHNFAALSLGNIASQSNAGATSRPRDAALQGLAKMRFVMSLGLTQGYLLPLERPNTAWLRSLGFAGDDDAVCAAAHAADARLFAQACSASSMWTANAATVSPAPDTHDRRTHLTVANLSRMVHRSHEHADTESMLRRVFAHPHFAVHAALPACFGDEGAANHMRLAPDHHLPGVELFVYGEEGSRFPARQSQRASQAVARRHTLADSRVIFVEQSREAIDAGAFHNDVVAVANGPVLFAHQSAFADPQALRAALAKAMPEAIYIVVSAADVPLSDAISSYLFNSQLLTLQDASMALVVPSECQTTPSVSAYLARLVTMGTPIKQVHFVDVRESMRNGGGPACLRLRVTAAPHTVDPRFLLTDARADALQSLIEREWPEAITPADLGHKDLWHQARAARAALFRLLAL